jgi:pimeloyl-ACP methyl ester carboxylesterase
MVTPAPSDQNIVQHSGRPAQSRRFGVGLIVVASMVAGLLVAAGLVVAPFVPAQEHILIGVILLSFALGWAILAVLSVRFSDQPQRWAVAPAIFMGLAGLAALSGSAAIHAVVKWVWAPVLLALVVWIFIRSRKQLHSRSRWLVLYPVLATLVIASLGGAYETTREALDARAYPAPGKLIDVDGHRLHLYCTGLGSPTVVMEPGAGASAWDLALISESVAADTRVCVYDRAGHGWSEPADNPQDGASIATDLHTLLKRANEQGPYVLAGHSFGGLYVMRYAAQYPDQVAGMVLLDSTAPKPGEPTKTDTASYDRVLALLPAISHLGVGRLLAHFAYDSLPSRLRSEARANASTVRDFRSAINDYGIGNASMQQASSLKNLNGKPLIVVTADELNEDGWQVKQDHLATLSANSLHRHAKATHSSLVSDPVDAAEASRAISDVVDAVRASRQLAER